MGSMIKDLTIQDFLAVIVSMGVFGLILCKYQVPDQIWSGWMVIITFFFNQPQKNGESNAQNTISKPISPAITTNSGSSTDKPSV